MRCSDNATSTFIPVQTCRPRYLRWFLPLHCTRFGGCRLGCYEEHPDIIWIGLRWRSTKQVSRLEVRAEDPKRKLVPAKLEVAGSKTARENICVTEIMHS